MNKSNPSSTPIKDNIINHHRKRIRLIKIFVLLLILIVCTTYPILKIRWAHKQVESFCAQVAIDMPIQGLEARAEELGLKVKLFKAVGSRPLKIIVWEGWVFARWFCEIEHVNGKVINKESFFLD